MTADERRPRASRLTGRVDRTRILESGRRRRSRFLECIWMDNTVGHPRMGLIVPKFQSTAVARNRLRRRLSEIWRRELQGAQGGRDLLIRAKREAYAATFEELRSELSAWTVSL